MLKEDECYKNHNGGSGGTVPCDRLVYMERSFKRFQTQYKQDNEKAQKALEMRDDKIYLAFEETKGLINQVLIGLQCQEVTTENHKEDITEVKGNDKDMDTRLRLLETLVSRLSIVNIIVLALLTSFLSISTFIVIKQLGG
jgi:hypothetical protein